MLCLIMYVCIGNLKVKKYCNIRYWFKKKEILDIA